MIAVGDDPVEGIVPVDPDGLPPVLAPLVEPPPTAVVAPATTNVTVRCSLAVPVMVTVYVPGVVGAVNVPVAAPVAVCAGRRNPATLPVSSADEPWHDRLTDDGVDCGCENVIVSPTSQFRKATL